jgi:hypothetical protein
MWKATLALIFVSASVAASPDHTPYDVGRITIHVGIYTHDANLVGFRFGAGYNVVRGLELGLAGIHEWGEGGVSVETVEPFAVYHFTQWYESFPLVPSVGLSYLHRWTWSPGSYVPEALGIRAGLEYTVSRQPVPLILGAGVQWNHPLAECGFDDCAMYGKNPEEVGPEIFAVVGF